MSLLESSLSTPLGEQRRGFIHGDGDAAQPEHSVFADHVIVQWIYIETRARLLVDEKLTIYWNSAAAHELLDARGDKIPLLHRGSRLFTTESRSQRELAAFVSRANGKPSTFCLYVDQPEDYILIAAMRLCAPWQHLIGLTLHLASETIEARVEDLKQAFGLTPAEARVANSLLGGKTAEETSEELGVSLETVRTHIKRAYAKLGVSSREGFFHMLTPFVASMTEPQSAASNTTSLCAVLA
jgi:DNA-binding CsgD family transcriptional regulator